MKKYIAGILAAAVALSTASAVSADNGADESIEAVTAEFDASVKKGDANCDGKKDIEDVAVIMSYINGITPLQDEQIYAADVNGDDAIDIVDAALLLKDIVGILPEEPKEPEDTRPRTSKGYVIETIDGITYVDGVMIVNKSYSLPSSYAPGGLTSETQAAFNKMKAAASKDGISLWNASGYRSYWYQNTLYWNYVSRDGQAAADRYSARAGHSEHQTGLALDINNPSSSFNGTKAAKWIEAHCAEYGFILRYPQGKESVTGYMYESWHVRYVGKELAKKITDSGLTMEEYFGIDSYYH